MKIWACGSSPRSGSRNAWTWIRNVNGASRLSNFWNFFVRRDPNDFLSWLVTMDETWLYHYDPETKKQSMDWRHSGSPRPKNSECRNSVDKYSPRFLGIKTASSSLIVFQRAKLSTRSITHLWWCKCRTFWRKNAAGKSRSPRGSCSCMTMPRLIWHVQPRRNWHTWASSVLISHHILRIWPRQTTTCPLDWKKNWKFAIFVRGGGHCCRGDLVGRTAFWIFLSGLQKLEQWAKKCIELRGECVE